MTLAGLPDSTHRIELDVTSPRGFLVNTWRLEDGDSDWSLPPVLGKAEAEVVVKVNADGSLSIGVGAAQWSVSATGSVSVVYNGTKLVQAGPTLMVLAIAKNDFTQLTEQNDRCVHIPIFHVFTFLITIMTLNDIVVG